MNKPVADEEEEFCCVASTYTVRGVAIAVSKETHTSTLPSLSPTRYSICVNSTVTTMIQRKNFHFLYWVKMVVSSWNYSPVLSVKITRASLSPGTRRTRPLLSCSPSPGLLSPGIWRFTLNSSSPSRAWESFRMGNSAQTVEVSSLTGRVTLSEAGIKSDPAKDWNTIWWYSNQFTSYTWAILPK